MVAGHRVRVIALLAGAILDSAAEAAAQSAPRPGANTRTPTAPAATTPSAGRLAWGNPQADARYQVLEHALVPVDLQSGKTAELLRLASGNGSYIQFSRPIAEARVIEELRIDLSLKSERAGGQLSARVVLPRSLDPESGQPVTCIIQGARYTEQGYWQKLRIEGFPQEVERQARLLRGRPGWQIDTREAYVDQILVNVYTGAGNSSTLLGELEITGLIRRDLADGPGDESSPHRRRPEIMISPPVLQGAILSIESRPFYPRSIEHRGEPLPFLQQLGFNTIRCKQLPDEALFDEAASLGLWVICPPPFGPPVGNSISPPPEEIAAEVYDPVLAWDLGAGMTNAEFPSTKTWIEQLRNWDRQRNRPLVAAPHSNLLLYGRYIDILLLDRAPLGTSEELADYRQWVHQRPRLSMPGRAVWTALATQPSKALVDQCRVLASNGSLEVSFSPDQLRLLVYSAISAGSRGLLVGSESRLDAEDVATCLRRETLELLNLELSLVDPWLAAGQGMMSITGSEPQARGALIPAEQARILVPIWVDQGAQHVPGQSAGYNLSFLLPGIPESHEPYELTGAGFTRPKSRRVAGGMRLTLDEFDVTSLVALSQDPLVVSSLERRVNLTPERATRLVRSLTVARLMKVTEIDRELTAMSRSNPHAGTRLETARKNLAECDRLLGEQKFTAAYREAVRSSRPLRLLERLYWDASVQPFTSGIASPLAATSSTLIDHQRWLNAVNTAAWLPSNIRQGEFENLNLMHQQGWRHFQHADRAVGTSAELSALEPHSGRYSLLLKAQASNPKNPPGLIETPPLWITSPTIDVTSGQSFRIRGWVRVRTPITGSLDGLMILDSLSGEPLAERIDRTEGWKEFILYRAAPQSGRLAITFALSGLGEAWIDDVRVELRTDTAPNAQQVNVPPATSPLPASPGAPPAARQSSLPSRLR